VSNLRLVTSESVTEGHPDKVADQISDGVLDAILAQDPYGRVACETLVTTGLVIIAGEITTTCGVDYGRVARETIRKIGYTDPSTGFDDENCEIRTFIKEQSEDIAMGVNETSSREQGAGDQGMMYGYATAENDQFMPTPILLAHRLCEQLARVRKEGVLPYLRPDGKTQVTVEYNQDQPVRVHTVVVSTQHQKEVSQEQIRQDVIDQVILPVIPSGLMRSDLIVHVNPTGKFVLGGPAADCGLTGRKIIVDTYGGLGRHGGGAFSGKDPTKVDRSACYAVRHIAKNVVAAGLAKKVEIQVAYAIGVAEPVAIYVDDFGTGRVPTAKLEKAVRDLFDMRPRALIERLNLRRPIYQKTAAYGHFGRNESDFGWEALDYVEQLKKAVEVKSAPLKPAVKKTQKTAKAAGKKTSAALKSGAKATPETAKKVVKKAIKAAPKKISKKAQKATKTVKKRRT